jgi:LysM repeat protein
MSPDSTSPTKVCTSCGTRIPENATRCLVCGRAIKQGETESAKSIRGPRLPEITVNLPVALGMIILLMAVGAGVVYAILQNTGQVVVPTVTVTPSYTSTMTLTPTASLTPSPQPTATELPPLKYVVKSGDYCSTIAGFFNVSIQSIVLFNNLTADCEIFVGKELLIPQPTATPSPQPSVTLSGEDATQEACQKADYTVTDNDTLGGIARNYNVSMESIKEFNGLPNDIVYSGQLLYIPLCKRLPTPGPTPTPTLPPPYPAPSLLLPADGTAFLALNETITLQWAAVGTLLQSELYAVTIEDVTSGIGKKVTEYVADTRFIVPASLRPTDNIPHIFKWYVTAVRQTGTDKDGKAVYDSAGMISDPRYFSWTGSIVLTPTP